MKYLFHVLALLFLPFSAQAVVLLQYHHVSDDTPKSTSVSPALFAKHLDYLVEQDFDVIGLDKLAELIRKGAPLPDKTVVITFDDGYSSVHDKAWPMLEERGLPFAVFINTQPHNSENPNFMRWQQMQNMADQGVIFANHTVTHPHLIRQAPGESPTEWRERVWHEIDTAERTIHRQLNQNHRLLAYPFGEFSAELQKLLAQNGYLAFGQQSGPLGERDNPQALPRFPFGGSYGDMQDFATKVNTRPLPLKRARAEKENGKPLAEPELPGSVERPRLVLTLADELKASQVTCFASGQGRIEAQAQDNQLVVQAPKPLSVGRSRYNCTAPTGEKGRFYWYSVMFIQRPPGGGWYEE